MDPDPDLDPAIFGIDLRDAKKKFFLLLFEGVHLHLFSKINSQKEVTTVGIKVFLTFFA
jgi:hypothetical protein